MISQSPEYYQEIAEHFTEIGQFEVAATYYRQAIELQSNSEFEADNFEADKSDPDSVHTVTISQDTDSSTLQVHKSSGKTIRIYSLPSTTELSRAADPADSADPADKVETSHSWFEEAAFYLQQAKLLCDQKQWKSAIEACKSAIKFLDPYCASAHRLLGLALQSEHRLAEAEQSYLKSLMLQPQIAETHARLGSAYAEQEKLEDSINHYEQAIALDAKFTGAYLKLGNVWHQLGDDAQAIAYWYEAAQLQPDWVTVPEYLRLGKQLVEQNQLEQATWCYQQAIAVNPTCADAYAAMAEVLSQQEKWQEAVEQHRTAIRLAPKVAKFHAGLGRTLAKLEQWQAAIDCYQSMTALEPDYPEFQDAVEQLEYCQQALISHYYYQMGTTLTQQQEWQAAANAYRQAIDRNPQSAKFQASLGQVLIELQQWQDALTCYQAAVKLDPEQTSYSKALVTILMQLGQLEAATQYYSQLLSPLPKSLDQPGSPTKTRLSHDKSAFAMF